MAASDTTTIHFFGNFLGRLQNVQNESFWKYLQVDMSNILVGVL